MKISKRITNYLRDNNWVAIMKEDTLHHYIKVTNYSTYHIYITYFEADDDYEVELGIGDTQDSSTFYKLRNIVSVLKRKGF